jgi:hypothetical protein
VTRIRRTVRLQPISPRVGAAVVRAGPDQRRRPLRRACGRPERSRRRDRRNPVPPPAAPTAAGTISTAGPGLPARTVTRSRVRPSHVALIGTRRHLPTVRMRPVLASVYGAGAEGSHRACRLPTGSW